MIGRYIPWREGGGNLSIRVDPDAWSKEPLKPKKKRRRSKKKRRAIYPPPWTHANKEKLKERLGESPLCRDLNLSKGPR